LILILLFVASFSSGSKAQFKVRGSVIDSLTQAPIDYSDLFWFRHDTAPVMEAYANAPAGDLRRAIAAGTFPIKGNIDTSEQAMIDSVLAFPAPLRLALGGGAYDMRAALISRLEALDAQKELALASEKSN